MNGRYMCPYLSGSLHVRTLRTCTDGVWKGNKTNQNLSGVIEPLPSISNKLNKSLISANSRLVNWSPALMLKFPCKSFEVTIHAQFYGHFYWNWSVLDLYRPFPWFKLFLNSKNFYLKSQTELGGSIWRVFSCQLFHRPYHCHLLGQLGF